ncbi:IS21 family transposase [Desulfotomaculum defluvii]
MLKMVDIEYIRKKHFIEGWSIRKISRNLNVARQTVRKALQSSDIPKYNLSQNKPCPVMDPYKNIIREWLEFDKTQPPKQRHTARRIFNRLCEEFDFTGSESSVRRFIQLERNTTKEVFVPLTADWGEQAQVDWGRAKVYINDRLTEVCLFCLRLKASLVPFVWASPTEKLEAFLEGHRLAFEWLGGVPETIVYDNPKTAVTKILKGPYRVEHTMLSSLRAHYLFDSEFCTPSRANQKGTVENLVKYVRRNAMVPLPRVNSLEELNQKLISWCEKQRQTNAKNWELERLELRPLPASPFRCCKTNVVKANSLLLFQFERNYYSVPMDCGHKRLRVEAFVDKLEVYDSNKLVAIHNRSYKRGEKVMELEHYLPVIARKPRAAKNALVVRKLPEVYQKLRVMLCKRSPEGYREYAKILLLNMEYNFKDVLTAVEDSLKSGYIGLEHIRQLLISKGLRIKHTVKGVATNTLPNLDIPVDSPSKFNYLIGGATT